MAEVCSMCGKRPVSLADYPSYDLCDECLKDEEVMDYPNTSHVAAHNIPSDWYEEGYRYKGYSWLIQAKYGTVYTTEEELFGRPEFAHLDKHEYKVAYAMDLGWRFNVDNQKWYRIRGY